MLFRISVQLVHRFDLETRRAKKHVFWGVFRIQGWSPVQCPVFGGQFVLNRPYRDPVVPSQKVLGPSWHLHSGVSNHLLRRYDWIPRDRALVTRFSGHPPTSHCNSRYFQRCDIQQRMARQTHRFVVVTVPGNQLLL